MIGLVHSYEWNGYVGGYGIHKVFRDRYMGYHTKILVRNQKARHFHHPD